MRAFCILAFRFTRPARHERGEGWGEGQLNQTRSQPRASSPRPSPPSNGGEGVELRSIARPLFWGGAR